MKKQILDIFARDGYRIWSDGPYGSSVFYKYQNEGFGIVLVIEEQNLLKEEKLDTDSVANYVAEFLKNN